MVDPAHRAPLEGISDLLQTLGGLLLKYGSPTHRIEACLRRMAREHRYRAQVFAVPTGLWMTVIPFEGGEYVTRVLRVHDRVIDLDRLANLDRIFNEFSEGSLSAGQAMAQLEMIDSAPPRYPLWQLIAGCGLASGATGLFFGARTLECILGTIAGFCVMIFGRMASFHRRTRLLVDIITGLIAGAMAWLGTLIDPAIARKPIIVATIISVVPGLTLASGIEEVAERSFVSGAARMLNAMMVLISLIAGFALMSSIEQAVMNEFAHGIIAGSPPYDTSWLILGISAMLGGLGFSLYFCVPPHDIPYATIAGGISWAVAYITEQFFKGGTLASGGVAIAAGAGTMAVGIFSNAMARLFNRPSQIYMVPGIVMIVPGVFGFTSTEKFLIGDMTGGMAGLSSTLMITGAMVIGMLIANAAMPPNKAL